jgi:hypothetical protein
MSVAAKMPGAPSLTQYYRGKGGRPQGRTSLY